jgi:hypothetical protein
MKQHRRKPMKIKPLSDRVLIRPADPKHQKHGSIIIPDPASVAGLLPDDENDRS